MYASSNKSHYDARTGCLRKENALSRYHNSALFQAVSRLRRKYPDAKIVYADYYAPVIIKEILARKGSFLHLSTNGAKQMEMHIV
jgi:hypothetical protein